MAKYCFCGISGSGMSALAQILKFRGNEVYGSDAAFDNGRDEARKKHFESLGIKIFPQDGSQIDDDVECLFLSAAIKGQNPDVDAANAKNIPIKYRSDLLANLFHQYKHSIAISGTSGKTTTTAMVGYILNKLAQKPTVIGGGIFKNYEAENDIANYIYNDGDICVIEADESDGSLVKYHPYIGVINNISNDHQPIEVLEEFFAEFATRCDFGLIVNDDCEYLSEINHHKNTVRYALDHRPVRFSLKNPDADLFATNIKPIKGGISYDLGNQNFKLNLLGNFNVSNALAAIAVCELLGIDKYDAATALESFLGTKRRLELIGVKNNITVIDDFAHNPDKIYNSTKALKDYDGRIIVMFQPHGVPNMKIMGMEIMESYAKVLGKDDILVMPEIFLAAPEDLTEMSSQKLIDYAKSMGVNAHFLGTKENCKNFMAENAKSGDRILIQGARDNSLPAFCVEVLEAL
ncbi:MAG: Mur ligase family protein [Alphaproteobacteria bacterium]